MNILNTMREQIAAATEGGDVDVAEASPGHYTIRVVSPVFAGKSLLQKQRLVLNAIKDLMAGANAPVHAVDKIETIIPDA